MLNWLFMDSHSTESLTEFLGQVESDVKKAQGIVGTTLKYKFRGIECEVEFTANGGSVSLYRYHPYYDSFECGLSEDQVMQEFERRLRAGLRP